MTKRTILVVSILSLFLGMMFFTLVMSSSGGITGNTRMTGSSWFFIVSSILGFIGTKYRNITIAAVVFWYLSALYNLAMSIEWAANIVLSLISVAFAVSVNVLLCRKHE